MKDGSNKYTVFERICFIFIEKGIVVKLFVLVNEIYYFYPVNNYLFKQ